MRRTERVNLGLALLELAAKPGQPLTLRDIAAWCDVSYKGIYMIEQKALIKLRNKIRFGRAAAFGREARHAR